MENKLNVIESWRKKLHASVPLLLLTPSLLLGQTDADIQGYILDSKSEETLPYANVVLKHINRGAISNSDGYFVITDVPVGVCSLQVSFMGYQPLLYTIQLHPVDNPILEIKLDPQSLSGDQVEVYAERYKIMQAAERVSQVSIAPRDLQILPNFGEVDVFRSLQLLPGVSGFTDGKAGLYIRGGTPDENMVLYDGMTIYHVDHFFGMFSAFNPESIKDVQLYKGGYPAKYGGRLSSVVELTGKEGSNERSYSWGVNLLSANLLFQTPFWEDKANWIFSARRSYSDLINTPLYNNIYEFSTGDVTEEQAAMGGGMGKGAMQTSFVPSFYYYDVNSKLTLRPRAQDKLSLSLYTGRDYLDKSRDLTMQGGPFQISGGTEFDTRVDENTTDWGNIGASLRWAHQWNSRGFSSLLVSGSEYTSNYNRELSVGDANVVGADSLGSTRGLSGFAQDEFNTVQDFTLSFENQYQVSPLHKIEFGLHLANVGTDYQASIRDTIPILEVSSLSQAYATYLQDEWTVTSGLNLTLGLRNTYHEQTNQFYVAPRASFNWVLTPRISLKGAWGKYYQFINSIENEDVLQGSKNFWLSADENIKPSSSVHNVLGIQWENPEYLIDIEAYHKDSKDLVEFSRRFRDAADYLNYFYFGDGVAKGLEFLFQKKRGVFSGWLGYTLGSVEYTFPNLNEGEAYPATHDRTHELKLVGSYAMGPWTLASTFMYATGRAYTAPESQYFLEMLDGNIFSYIHVGDKNAYRLPDSHQLDISLSRSFETDYWNWDAGLSIYNVLNHANVIYRDYDLDVSPIVISDVTSLGITPTVFIKANIK